MKNSESTYKDTTHSIMINIRKNLTMTNPYYISKHHYLQYPELERRIALERSRRLKFGLFIDTGIDECIDDKVSEIACNVAYLEMWECEESDPTIANYIFKAVTEGKSYNTLWTRIFSIYFLNVVNSFSHIVHLL